MAARKRAKQTESTLLAGFRSRLCAVVGASVLVALSALSAVYLTATYISREGEMVDELGVQIRALVGAALDTRANHDLFDMMQMGDNLIRSTPITGGVVLDPIGATLGAFGTEPGLQWREATLGDVPYMFDAGDSSFEIFLSPSSIKLDHGLILSYDATGEHRLVIADIVRQGATGAAIAIGITLLTMFIVGLVVIAPLNRVRAAIEAVLQDPDNTDSLKMAGLRGPELIRLADAVGDLMFIASAGSGDGAGSGDVVLEDVPMPAIRLSEHGFVTNANQAALDLFDAESDVEIGERVNKGAFFLEGEEAACRDIVAEGDMDGTCEIRLGKRRIPCLISSSTLERSDGSSCGHMVVFCDVSDLVADMKSETEKRVETETALQVSERRIADYRQLFDCCLILLGSGEEEPALQPVTIMPEMLITSWLGEMVRREGITLNNVRHNSLPPLIGTAARLRKIFQLALSAIWTRSLQEKPVLFVQGSIEDQNNARFTIREIHQTSENQSLLAADSAEAPILLGALGRIIGKGGGRIQHVFGGLQGDLNEVSFLLPLDTVTMCAIIADDAPDDMPGVDKLIESAAA